MKIYTLKYENIQILFSLTASHAKAALTGDVDVSLASNFAQFETKQKNMCTGDYIHTYIHILNKKRTI